MVAVAMRAQLLQRAASILKLTYRLIGALKRVLQRILLQGERVGLELAVALQLV
jgi:hypothetical protein